MFFIPTSIVTTIINAKNKRIDWKVAIPVANFGMLGAIIGARISTKISGETLKKCFGIFLGIVAINEIYNLVKMHNEENKNK